MQIHSSRNCFYITGIIQMKIFIQINTTNISAQTADNKNILDGKTITPQSVENKHRQPDTNKKGSTLP